MIFGINTMIITKTIGERQDEQPSLKITLSWFFFFETCNYLRTSQTLKALMWQ